MAAVIPDAGHVPMFIDSKTLPDNVGSVWHMLHKGFCLNKRCMAQHNIGIKHTNASLTDVLIMPCLKYVGKARTHTLMQCRAKFVFASVKDKLYGIYEGNLITVIDMDTLCILVLNHLPT